MTRFEKDGVIRHTGDRKYVIMLDGTRQRPTAQSFRDAGLTELVPNTNDPMPETFDAAKRRIRNAVYAEHKRLAENISNKYPDCTVAQWDKWRSWGEAGNFSEFDDMAGANQTGLEFWTDRVQPKILIFDSLSRQLEAKKNNILWDLEQCITVEDIAAIESTMNEVWDNEADFGKPTGALQGLFEKIMNSMFFRKWE